MNSLGYEYQSDFARRYVAEGRAEVVLRLLTLRFGALAEEIQLRIRGAQDAQWDAMVERLLTAQTLEAVLSPLPKSAAAP